MSVTVNSPRFGVLEIPDEGLIEFPLGLIGIEGHRYALVGQGDDSAFAWLHSLDDPSFALPVMNPWQVFVDYEVEISDAEAARIIDEEVKKLVDALELETKQMLATHRDKVQAVADALLKYETLDANDVERIMRGEALTRPSISDMLDAESKRRPGTTIQPGPDASEPDITGGLTGPLPSPG